jgi:glycerol-3-phosphate acyltransferase PlsX
MLPTGIDGKNVFLLDAGANADCKPINLCQFAVMGSVYAKILGVNNPKVALLSNGTEDEKGNALNHEVFPVLKEMKEINFVGNVEARDILSGEYDVIVADGFSGNVALKSIEGTAKFVMKSLKSVLTSSLKAKLGALMLKSSLYGLKEKMDYNNKGGALFIGLKKPVIKVHGSAKRDAVRTAILQASKYAEFDIVSEIEKCLSAVTISEQN